MRPRLILAINRKSHVVDLPSISSLGSLHTHWCRALTFASASLSCRPYIML